MTTQKQTQTVDRRTRDAKKVKKLRYWVLGWLLMAGVLNYMDRSSVALAAPHMIKELGLTRTDIGIMGTVFSWTYAFCQLPAGYLIDKLGAKRVYIVAVAMWSVATSLMAIGQNLTHFLIFRFLLGIGESPNSPNSSKITTAWFPREERGQAAGIWDSGSKWGSAAAPPILTALIYLFGWRMMFVFIGAAGLVLAASFWAFFRMPEESKHLSDEEYRHILLGRDEVYESKVHIPWLSFFRYRQTWGLMLGFFTSIWIWNIFITFLPLYLQDSLNVSILNTGIYAAIPYVVAALFGIYGGRVTLNLVRRRGLSSIASKRRVLITSALITGVLLCLIPLVQNLLQAEIVLSLALGLTAIIQAQSWAISSDLVPDTHAARFGGIMNFGGYFGGALAPVATGVIFDRTGSYSPSFIIAGIIAALGALIYWGMVRTPIDPKSLVGAAE